MPKLLDCLDIAASGEEWEHNDLYKRCYEDAKKEGFEHLAAQFAGVREIEATHGKRYRDLIARIKKGFFKRGNKIWWQCQNCGHLHYGVTAPMLCPVCNHPQAYFQETPKKNY
jgi:rubrerythrin